MPAMPWLVTHGQSLFALVVALAALWGAWTTGRWLARRADRAAKAAFASLGARHREALSVDDAGATITLEGRLERDDAGLSIVRDDCRVRLRGEIDVLAGSHELWRLRRPPNSFARTLGHAIRRELRPGTPVRARGVIAAHDGEEHDGSAYRRARVQAFALDAAERPVALAAAPELLDVKVAGGSRLAGAVAGAGLALIALYAAGRFSVDRAESVVRAQKVAGADAGAALKQAGIGVAVPFTRRRALETLDRAFALDAWVHLPGEDARDRRAASFEQFRTGRCRRVLDAVFRAADPSLGEELAAQCGGADAARGRAFAALRRGRFTEASDALVGSGARGGDAALDALAHLLAGRPALAAAPLRVWAGACEPRRRAVLGCVADAIDVRSAGAGALDARVPLEHEATTRPECAVLLFDAVPIDERLGTIRRLRVPDRASRWGLAERLLVGEYDADAELDLEATRGPFAPAALLEQASPMASSFVPLLERAVRVRYERTQMPGAAASWWSAAVELALELAAMGRDADAETWARAATDGASGLDFRDSPQKDPRPIANRWRARIDVARVYLDLRAGRRPSRITPDTIGVLDAKSDLAKWVREANALTEFVETGKLQPLRESRLVGEVPGEFDTAPTNRVLEGLGFFQRGDDGRELARWFRLDRRAGEARGYAHYVAFVASLRGVKTGAEAVTEWIGDDKVNPLACPSASRCDPVAWLSQCDWRRRVLAALGDEARARAYGEVAAALAAALARRETAVLLAVVSALASEP